MHTSKTAVVALMRIAWRTVGSVVARVVAEGRAAGDPFDGLRRTGIDGTSGSPDGWRSDVEPAEVAWWWAGRDERHQLRTVVCDAL